jgi:cytoskeletal protein CcmA (bactofilin family)
VTVGDGGLRAVSADVSGPVDVVGELSADSANVAGMLTVWGNAAVRGDAAVVGQLAVGAGGAVVEGLLDVGRLTCSGDATLEGPVRVARGVVSNANVVVSGTLAAATVQAPSVIADALRAVTLDAPIVKATTLAAADDAVLGAAHVEVLEVGWDADTGHVSALNVTPAALVCGVPARFDAPAEVQARLTVLGDLECVGALHLDPAGAAVAGDVRVEGALRLAPGTQVTCDPGPVVLSGPGANVTGTLGVTGDVRVDGELRTPALTTDDLQAVAAIIGHLEAGTVEAGTANCLSVEAGHVTATALLEVMGEARVQGDLAVSGTANVATARLGELRVANLLSVEGVATAPHLTVSVEAQVASLWAANAELSDATVTGTLDVSVLEVLQAALESATVADLDATLLAADTVTVSELLTAHHLTLANAATVTGYLQTTELRANNAIVDANTLVVVGTADIRRLNCVAVVTTGNIETVTASATDAFIGGTLSCNAATARTCDVAGELTAGTLHVREGASFLAGSVTGETVIRSAAVECATLDVSGATTLAACNAAALSVTGPMVVEGPLTCQGNAHVVGGVSAPLVTAANCDVTDTVTVSGAMRTGTLVVTSDVRVDGTLTSSHTECGELRSEALTTGALEAGTLTTGVLTADTLSCQATLRAATLEVSGPTALAGTLIASGDVNVAGTLRCSSAEAARLIDAGGLLTCAKVQAEQLNTPALFATAVDADELRCNVAGVTDTVTLPEVVGLGKVEVQGLLTVGGMTVVSSNVTISSPGSTNPVVNVAGLLETQDLTVTNVLTFENLFVTDLSVTRLATVTGNIHASGGLQAERATVRAANLTCTGLLSTGAAAVTGNLDVSGNLAVVGAASTRTLDVAGELTAGTLRCTSSVTAPDLVADALTVVGSLSVEGPATFRNDLTVLGALTVAGNMSSDVAVSASELACSGRMACGSLAVGSTLSAPTLASPGPLTLSAGASLSVLCADTEALRVTPTGLDTGDVFIDGNSVKTLLASLASRNYVEEAINRAIREWGVSVSALSGRFMDMADVANLLNMAEFDKHMARVEDQLAALNTLVQNNMGCAALEGMIKKGASTPALVFSSGTSLTLTNNTTKTYYVVES